MGPGSIATPAPWYEFKIKTLKDKWNSVIKNKGWVNIFSGKYKCQVSRGHNINIVK